jgi:pimeloyl-ACP methyl ester carboxylesterase
MLLAAPYTASLIPVLLPAAHRLAERYNLMVVCPEFTQDAFPDTNYNFGAVEKGSKQRTWAFTSIEYIFDELLHAGVKKEGYSLFGHSAGAQFAHRMTLFAPRGCRALNIVAANAGWYTNTFLKSGSYPYKWPYSLIGAPVAVKTDHLEVIFSRKLLVMIGQEDIGLRYLRVTKAAEAQGSNRFERGLDFFLNARKLAQSLELPFNWSLQTVPQVGHSNKHMAFVTAARLFSEPLARVQVLADADGTKDEEDEEAEDGQAAREHGDDKAVAEEVDSVALLMERMTN